MRVLVLDQTWAPARIVDLKRAVLLLVSGKAIPVTDVNVGVMHSPSVEINVPAVIQVSTLIKNGLKNAKPPDCSRARVLTRDNRECQFVIGGRPCVNKGDTIDHLIPQSRGGKDTWENLVAACFKHNGVKADRTLEQMTKSHDWSLKRKPYAPRFMIKALSAESIHPEWEVFLGMAKA